MAAFEMIGCIWNDPSSSSLLVCIFESGVGRRAISNAVNNFKHSHFKCRTYKISCSNESMRGTPDSPARSVFTWLYVYRLEWCLDNICDIQKIVWQKCNIFWAEVFPCTNLPPGDTLTCQCEKCGAEVLIWPPASVSAQFNADQSN